VKLAFRCREGFGHGVMSVGQFAKGDRVLCWWKVSLLTMTKVRRSHAAPRFLGFGSTLPATSTITLASTNFTYHIEYMND
jgi:hypothetical protein